MKQQMQKKNLAKPDFGFLIANNTLDSIDGDFKNFKNPISPSEDYHVDKRSKNPFKEKLMIQEDLNPDFSSILMKESNLFNKSNTDNMLDNLDDDKEQDRKSVYDIENNSQNRAKTPVVGRKTPIPHQGTSKTPSNISVKDKFLNFDDHKKLEIQPMTTANRQNNLISFEEKFQRFQGKIESKTPHQYEDKLKQYREKYSSYNQENQQIDKENKKQDKSYFVSKQVLNKEQEKNYKPQQEEETIKQQSKSQKKYTGINMKDQNAFDQLEILKKKNLELQKQIDENPLEQQLMHANKKITQLTKENINLKEELQQLKHNSLKKINEKSQIVDELKDKLTKKEQLLQKIKGHFFDEDIVECEKENDLNQENRKSYEASIKSDYNSSYDLQNYYQREKKNERKILHKHKLSSQSSSISQNNSKQRHEEHSERTNQNNEKNNLYEKNQQYNNYLIEKNIQQQSDKYYQEKINYSNLKQQINSRQENLKIDQSKNISNLILPIKTPTNYVQNKNQNNPQSTKNDDKKRAYSSSKYKYFEEQNIENSEISSERQEQIEFKHMKTPSAESNIFFQKEDRFLKHKKQNSVDMSKMNKKSEKC